MTHSLGILEHKFWQEMKNAKVLAATKQQTV
jgi:hypothetical protein